MSNLPKGWEEVKLGEILNIQTGKKNAQDSKENGEYPFFTRSIDTQKIDTYSFDTEALFIAGEGNFTVKYYKGKFDLHQRTYMLTALKENTVDLKFLQNNIQPKVYQLVATSVGSTVQSLRKPIIEALKIPLPPLEEQKKIADILSTVDKKIAFVEENINATEELKKGLMQKLLTEGIGHKDFKDSELGRIPESWEVLKLSEICKINMGQSPKSESYNENNIGLPLIQGNADIKNRKSLPRTYTSDITKKCDIGDIIMTVRAPVGAIAKSYHNACIGRGVCAITPKENNDFLYHFLVGYEDKWDKLSQGSTFTAVNGNDIKNIKLSYPPFEEQKQIAEILSTIDNKLENLKEKKQSFEELKKGLMQKLLTGEVRV